MEIKRKAYAKINLALEIINKRSDGYHNIRTIMQSISLHDNISLKKIREGINVSSNTAEIPVDETNLAYIAADLFLKENNINSGVEINIEKNIPVAAGLAGGSTDAASVLLGMRELFEVDVTLDSLIKIGSKIGADVPYCVNGGTVLAEGTGEILHSLRKLKDIYVLLVVPEIKISTKWAYTNYNIQQEKYDFKPILDAIEGNDHIKLYEGMFNVFERLLLKEHPVILDIKNELIEAGADVALMSGSGPAVFGFFEKKNESENAYRMINMENRRVFLTELV